MTTTRLEWYDLAAEVRIAVAELTGPIHAVQPVDGGFNSQIAVRLETEGGSVFVKGLKSDHPRAWTQRREAEVSRHTGPLAPRLLWTLNTLGWDLLGFEFIKGRHADYSPGSADLALLAKALTDLAAIPVPPLELKQAEDRWASFVDDPAVLTQFQGATLCHTDFNPENGLVDQGRLRLVDWAWATRGASWLDPALGIIWLIGNGRHSPKSAEAWASSIPAWCTAPPHAVDAFAEANARLWAGIASDNPGAWSDSLRDAAKRWSEYRQSLPVRYRTNGTTAARESA
ncbi:aminoglycoside phosphotransferase [Streptomyces sp. NPDC058268]|uniref:aminoglycoside phosphotransferase n=1 Tax=Streptomyces sp. NPDC058268 TaxID=3346413 RepID=UPI0036EC8324